MKTVQKSILILLMMGAFVFTGCDTEEAKTSSKQKRITERSSSDQKQPEPLAKVEKKVSTEAADEVRQADVEAEAEADVAEADVAEADVAVEPAQGEAVETAVEPAQGEAVEPVENPEKIAKSLAQPWYKKRGIQATMFVGGVLVYMANASMDSTGQETYGLEKELDATDYSVNFGNSYSYVPAETFHEIMANSSREIGADSSLVIADSSPVIADSSPVIADKIRYASDGSSLSQLLGCSIGLWGAILVFGG